jgi:hypothetical protein
MHQMHAAGDFILGYENGQRCNPWLLVDPGPRRNPWLPPIARVKREFFRNGSFGIVRRMEQDVGGFEAFVHRCAVKHNVSAAYIKAKILGRWENGSVVRPDEREQPRTAPSAAQLDAFDFRADRDGLGCPFGAHMRRMNGRDTHLAQPRARPLIRRGMPYGRAFDAANPSDGVDRGLLGVFFCASIEDQFEHLLSSWANANPLGPRNRSTVKDPLIGNHADPTRVYEIPRENEKVMRLDGFRSFTLTRGTLYAFFPGKTALRMIAEGAW